MTHLY